MVKTMSTCMDTLQGALKVLEDDGFVRSQPSGTFVTDNPPHLSRYAFVCGPDDDGHWQPFTASLRRELREIEEEFHYEFAFFDNITARPDTLEYQELLHDICSHRVAGLIFRGSPEELNLCKTPIVTEPGVPRVAIAGIWEGRPVAPGSTRVITADNSVSADRSLAWLFERGRRRVAILTRGHFVGKEIDNYLLGAQRRGMTIRPCWIHEALSPTQARRVTELLMLPGPEVRPDGIIVTSEFLIEPVGIGILAAGVRAGSDIEILAHSNMPCVGSPSVPMRRLGIDMRQRLRVALDLLARQQRGESVPPCVLLPPVFEEELSRPANGS